MTRRRRVKEQEAGTAEDRNTTDRPWESLLEILDGELNALPEKYRAPIVLCDLEGLSYREAAARLGCPQGTLSGRLTRARALLARRIAHRCPSVTAAVLPMLLARAATTSVPPALWTCTLRAGTALAAGKTLTESAASSKVGFLVQGVLKMLLLSKLKTVTSGLLILAAAVLTASMCVTWKSAHAAMPGEDPAPRIVVDQPTPSGKARATGGASERQEAIFEFRGTERSRKVVSLVVAGTAAPVLRLPIKDDVRVLVGGRLVGIDGLRVGSFIAIRLDPTNRVIQDIQSVELPGNAIILRSVKDLAHLEPPSEREVLRALPQGPGGVPRSRKVFRDDIQMVVECLPRQVDPPRFFPQVGRAELHRYHWKCTVYYRETVESRDPSSQPSKRARVEVVYIDKDYLVPVR